MQIKINFPTYNFIFECILNDTKTAQKIYEILPQESKINTWGEEIYFSLPIKLKNELPTLNVEEGDVAWWPEGCCFCIFFGRTPISTSEKPVPYSEVTLIGKLKNYNKEIKNMLNQLKPNTKVILEK